MDQTAADRVENLLKLAKDHFEDKLTPAEKVLFEKTANYGKGDPAKADPAEIDPAKANQWGSDRVLKADRIRWLCTDPEAVKYVQPHEGITIVGARIEGQLHLSHAEIGFPISIKNSAIR
ncbi:MAG: hypothetical protein KJ749_03545, partial [Planctomycetes bacterium]|nr:hypothetical protein [Planctomycetota bacterium]